jgi:hypothetical protein
MQEKVIATKYFFGKLVTGVMPPLAKFALARGWIPPTAKCRDGAG